MSSSVSSTSNSSVPSSSLAFPIKFVLSYEMKFKVFNKDLLKKQINNFNKIMNDKYFDFSFKFNDYSPSFLLLPFLKKLNSFNTVLVKKNKIDASDYFQVLELIRQIKTKMFRSIEKNYLEHGTIENLDVNLSESTNDLLDQLFNPEIFNKILNNKPMAEIFKTNYINPPELDVKEIFITKDDELYNKTSDSDYIKELEEENNKLKQNIKDLKKDNELADDNISKLRKEINELHNKTIDYDYIHVLDKRNKDLEKENEILKDQNMEFTKLTTSIMAEKSLLEQEIIDLRDALKKCKKECLTCEVREMIKENKKHRQNKKI